jgi:hypothetical protein
MEDLTQNDDARAIAHRLLRNVLDSWSALADLQTMFPLKDLSIDDAEAICGGIEGDVVTADAVTELLALYAAPEEAEAEVETYGIVAEAI